MGSQKMNIALRFLFALLIALLLPATRASAQATVFINISCAKYVEDTALEPSSHAYNWFVAGYLSATNLAKNRDSPTDTATYRVWLTTYCQQKPFDNFLQALTALDEHLGEGKNKAPSGRHKAL